MALIRNKWCHKSGPKSMMLWGCNSEMRLCGPECFTCLWSQEWGPWLLFQLLASHLLAKIYIQLLCLNLRVGRSILHSCFNVILLIMQTVKKATKGAFIFTSMFLSRVAWKYRKLLIPPPLILLESDLGPAGVAEVPVSISAPFLVHWACAPCRCRA